MPTGDEKHYSLLSLKTIIIWPGQQACWEQSSETDHLESCMAFPDEDCIAWASLRILEPQAFISFAQLPALMKSYPTSTF